MSDYVVGKCDLCGKEGRRSRYTKHRDDFQLHGVVVTIGVSEGGWGSRRDLLSWSAEVCDRCVAIAYQTEAAFLIIKRKLSGDARLSHLPDPPPAPNHAPSIYDDPLVRAAARAGAYVHRLVKKIRGLRG